MLNKFIDQIRLPFRKEKELYLSIYHIIGILPHNLEYYKTALLHKSVARRNEKGRPINNERLEFLGDAILDAIVGDIVFQHFSGKREGFLTNTRSKIVQRDTLNRLAKDMGITRLILSNGRSASHNSYLGGNAFEALVGALYLDHGYMACMQFMQKQILGNRININKVAYKEMNFKSKLLEWSQKNKVQLDFELIENVKDKDGNPTFRYKVVAEGISCGEGYGYTKKESQQEAARITYHAIRKEAYYADKIYAAKEQRLQENTEKAEYEEGLDTHLVAAPVTTLAGDEAINNAPAVDIETPIAASIIKEEISEAAEHIVERENIVEAAEAKAFE